MAAAWAVLDAQALREEEESRAEQSREDAEHATWLARRKAERERIEAKKLDEVALRRVHAVQPSIVRRAVDTVKRTVQLEAEAEQLDRKAQGVQGDYLPELRQDGQVRVETGPFGRRRIVGGRLVDRIAAAQRLRIHRDAYDD